MCGAKNSQPELEIVSSVFYRGRGAYLVGRVLREGQLPLPIALCLRHENERGIILDALLHGDIDLAIKEMEASGASVLQSGDVRDERD